MKTKWRAITAEEFASSPPCIEKYAGDGKNCRIRELARWTQVKEDTIQRYAKRVGITFEEAAERVTYGN